MKVCIAFKANSGSFLRGLQPVGTTEREGSSDGGGKGFGDSSRATSEKEGAEEGLLDKWYELRRIQSGEAGLWGPARRVS